MIMPISFCNVTLAYDIMRYLKVVREMRKKGHMAKGRKQKVHLMSLMFLSIMATVLIAMIVMTVAWVSGIQRAFNDDIEQIYEIEYENERRALKNRVDTAISYMNFVREETEQKLRVNIKNETYEAYAVMMKIYETYKDTKSKEEITEMIQAALEDVRFNNGERLLFYRYT